MKKILFMLLCLSLVVFLVACGGEKQKEATKETAASAETQQAKEGIEVVLNGTSSATEDEWDELEDGYELAIANITVTNNTTEAYEFNPMYLTLQYDNQAVSESFCTPKGQKVLDHFMIEPGKDLTGIVCFDVPIGTTEYNLYYNDFDNEIKLK